MRIFKKCTRMIMILIALSFASTNHLYSEVKRLTLDEAIEIALQNNAETRIAMMEIKKAEARVDEAFGYALPTVNLSANFMHYIEKPVIFFPDFEAMLGNSTYEILFKENVLPRDESKFRPMGLTEMSFFLTNSFETKLEASQILFNSAVFKGIGASKIYLNLSREALKGTAANTIVSVKRAFYGVLLTQEMLKIMNASLEYSREFFEYLQANYDQGFVSEFDLLRAQVQVENLRPAVMQLENGLNDAKNGLKILLGLKQNEEIEVEGEIVYNPKSMSNESELIVQALNKNYDLKTFEVKRQIDEEMIELDRSEYWPTIAAFGSYSIAGQSDEFDFMNYNTGVVGLSFSMNLFNGMRTNEKVQQAEILVQQTDEQLKQMKEFVKTQVKSKTGDINRTQSLIEAQERNVTMAQRAYEIANIKFREGTGTQLDIQNAELALRQAKTNKLQTTYEYVMAVSELEKLLGDIEPKYFQSLFKLRN